MRRWNLSLAILAVGGSLAVAAEIKPGGDAAWIEEAGGRVIRDAAGRITGVDFRASWVTDTDLRKLSQFP